MEHKLFLRPQTKFAKVMFLHVSVNLSTGGCLVRGGLVPGGVWFLGGGPGPGGAWWRPSPFGRLLLRVVRILLECILVRDICLHQHLRYPAYLPHKLHADIFIWMPNYAEIYRLFSNKNTFPTFLIPKKNSIARLFRLRVKCYNRTAASGNNEGNIDATVAIFRNNLCFVLQISIKDFNNIIFPNSNVKGLKRIRPSTSDQMYIYKRFIYYIKYTLISYVFQKQVVTTPGKLPLKLWVHLLLPE